MKTELLTETEVDFLIDFHEAITYGYGSMINWGLSKKPNQMKWSRSHDEYASMLNRLVSFDLISYDSEDGLYSLTKQGIQAAESHILKQIDDEDQFDGIECMVSTAGIISAGTFCDNYRDYTSSFIK